MPSLALAVCKTQNVLVLDNDNLLRKTVFTFAHDTPTPFIIRSHITRSNSNSATVVALFFFDLLRFLLTIESSKQRFHVSNNNRIFNSLTNWKNVGRVERDETRSRERVFHQRARARNRGVYFETEKRREVRGSDATRVFFFVFFFFFSW